jgi:transcriptional regulator with XRE-family HTH domain
MVRIDRSTRPEAIRAFRARVGCSQEALSADLGLGENAVYRYERYGAPRWMGLALLGLAVTKYELQVDDVRWLSHGY